MRERDRITEWVSELSTVYMINRPEKKQKRKHNQAKPLGHMQIGTGPGAHIAQKDPQIHARKGLQSQ